MLEKTGIQDEEVIDCLLAEYGLRVERLTFLPLGADLHTAVYKVETGSQIDFFLKLRSGDFNPAAVLVPDFLSRQGFKQVIPAQATLRGRLWGELPPYKTILYPYIAGRHAYDRHLSEAQWLEFGAALKEFHTTDFPQEIIKTIPTEEFSADWREEVRGILARMERETFSEELAGETSLFLKSRRRQIMELVLRAEGLAQNLLEEPPEFIPCHADIHGWNLLVDESGSLYLVDWDTLIMAPRERDLMFIGAGLGESGFSLQKEEELFYQGYGWAEINRSAIAYYRCNRILEDIALFCRQIFSSDEESEDRRQALVYLRSNFLPGGTIEQAIR